MTPAEVALLEEAGFSFVSSLASLVSGFNHFTLRSMTAASVTMPKRGPDSASYVTSPFAFATYIELTVRHIHSFHHDHIIRANAQSRLCITLL
ncbi:hypothetical protein Hypma_012951 [Hypsizygus marmoreus]|uniref:Uncharacterized protein n=1 Tax=Hypsizygus marmoreus TaxID=39966 RepID=A0A369JMZ8_HYPMA|nr:hypothetical protein Hypma_012951 [Hypsizygus marmoreus]